MENDEWNPLTRALRRQEQIGGTRPPEPAHEANPYLNLSLSPRSGSSRGLLDRVPSDFNQDRYRDPPIPYPRVDPYYGRKEQRSPPLFSPSQRLFPPDRDPPRMTDRPPLLDDYYAFRPASGPGYSDYPPVTRREPSPPPRPPPEPSSDYRPFPLLSAPPRNLAEAPLPPHPERKRALFDEVDPPPRRDDTFDSARSGQRKLFQDAVRSALLPNIEAAYRGVLPEQARKDPVSVPRTVDDFAQPEVKRPREDTTFEPRVLSERELPKVNLGWEQENEDRYRRDSKASVSAAESVPEERSFLAMQQDVRKEDVERKPNGFGLSQKSKKAEKLVTPLEKIRPVAVATAPVVPKPFVSKPVRTEAVKPLFPSVVQMKVGLEKGWDDTYPVVDTKADQIAPVPNETSPVRKFEGPVLSSLPAAPLFPMVRLEKTALLHYPSEEQVLHMDSCPKGLANPLLQQSPLPLSRPGMPNPLLETPRGPLLATYNRSESAHYPPRVDDRDLLRQRDLRRFENRDHHMTDTREMRDGRNGDGSWNRENYDDGHQRSEQRYGYVDERSGPVENYNGYRADHSNDYQDVERYAEQARPSAPRPPVYQQEALPIGDPNLREFYEQLAARSSSFSGDIFAVREEPYSEPHHNGSRRNGGPNLQELAGSSDTQHEAGSRTELAPGSSTVNKLLLNLIAALAEESGSQHQSSQGSADEIPVCEMEDAFTPDVQRSRTEGDSQVASQTPRWVEGFSGALSPPSKIPVNPTHSCYVCNIVFRSNEEFTQHIKSSDHAHAYGSSRPAAVETSSFRPVGGRYYY